jgi:leucyl-tRNA synthetase
MYEMFLGPLEQSKPWNTNGIEGVFKFLRKFWRLFHNEAWEFSVSNDAEPTKAELKSLHKIIRKVEEDIERFSFNTSVSSFMIAVNELTDLKCNKRAVLQDMDHHPVIIRAAHLRGVVDIAGQPGRYLIIRAFPKFNSCLLG